MRNYFLVSYDIVNNNRRRKVARIAKDYGDRLQYSVFGCSLTSKELGIFKNKVRRFIDRTTDQILFIDLGPLSDEEPIPDIGYVGKCWIPASTTNQII